MDKSLTLCLRKIIQPWLGVSIRWAFRIRLGSTRSFLLMRGRTCVVARGLLHGKSIPSTPALVTDADALIYFRDFFCHFFKPIPNS